MNSVDFKKLNTILEELLIVSSTRYASIGETLQAYVQFGLDKTGFETGIVSQIRGKEYTVLEVISTNKDLKKGMIFDLENTFCRETLKTNQTLYCANTIDSEYHDIPARSSMGIKSIVCTPLWVNKKIFGTLNFSFSQEVNNNERWTFLVRVVEVLGASLSKIIERNLYEEKFNTKSTKLTKLNEVLSDFIRINSIPNYTTEERLSNFIDLLLDYTQFENGFISSIEDQKYTILEASTIDDKLKKGSVFELCDTLCKEVVDKQTTVIHSSLKNKPQYQLKGRAFLDTQSVIGAPVFIKGKIVGTLTICSVDEKKNIEELEQFAKVTALIADKVGKIIYEEKIQNQLRGNVEELKRIEFIYNETQKMGHIGGWEFDLQTDELYWSDEVYRIHELPIGSNIPLEEAINFYHSDYRDLINNHVQNAIENQIPYENELKIVTAKGREKWIKAQGQAVVEKNKTVKLRGTFQDINNRREAEAIKEKQNRALNLFIEAMPDLYVRCDANYVVLDINSGNQFIPTLAPQSLLNHSIVENLPASIHEVLTPLIDSAIHKGKEARAEFGAMKNGKERLIEARFIPSKKGQTIGIIRDMTNFLKREKELQKLNGELERSNKDLEEFAYIASHDLQEPLRKVSMFGSRILKNEKEQLSDKGKDYLDRMTRATQRMQQLIDDLLLYSRVMGVQEGMQEVDLQEIVTNIKQDFSLKIEDLNGEINIGNLPSIVANPVSIQQLFLNIISNAIKFRKKEVPIKIQISCETKKDDYHLFVVDNGIGIEDNYAQQIFQPFKRLHSKTEYKGTGIGLAICQKIVLQLGGQIIASGKIGEGTTITIILPK